VACSAALSWGLLQQTLQLDGEITGPRRDPQTHSDELDSPGRQPHHRCGLVGGALSFGPSHPSTTVHLEWGSRGTNVCSFRIPNRQVCVQHGEAFVLSSHGHWRDQSSLLTAA
jgi:hypothetical protein